MKPAPPVIRIFVMKFLLSAGIMRLRMALHLGIFCTKLWQYKKINQRVRMFLQKKTGRKMSKKQKLIDKLRTRSRNFTYSEAKGWLPCVTDPVVAREMEALMNAKCVERFRKFDEPAVSLLRSMRSKRPSF